MKFQSRCICPTVLALSASQQQAPSATMSYRSSSNVTYSTKVGPSQNFSSYSHAGFGGVHRQSTSSLFAGVGSSGAFLSPGFQRFGDGVHRIEQVSTNSSLLEPLDLEIDPNIQVIRNQEKEQIKSLNNRFASFIEQVRSLEQHNKMLEVKWKLLQEQSTARSNYDNFYDTYIKKLHKELDGLDHEKVRLESDLHHLNSLVNDYKEKYEDEINKHHKCEEEYLFLKKDFDGGYVIKVELEAKRDQLADEIEFYRQLYDAEIRDLQSQIQDTTVIVEMDNSRKLDMDAIVAEVRAQYEDIAKRSRAEAELMYKTKYAEMQESAGRYGDDLKSTKAEIADMKRRMMRLQSEIDMVKTQENNLQNQIDEAVNSGDKAVANARKQLKELDEALQRDKHNMAFQVRQYQELMNVKLALDIEIATYRKLLEGEESRLETGIKTNLTKQTPMNYSAYSMESSRTPVHLNRPTGLVKGGGFHTTTKDAGVAVKSTTYTTTETTVIKSQEKAALIDGDEDEWKFQGKSEELLALDPREEEQVEEPFGVVEDEYEERVETMVIAEE